MSETVKEIIELINGAKIPSPHWVEDIVGCEDLKHVASLDPDKHRRYICTTEVFQIGDEFIGVFGPTTLLSEGMGYVDIGHTCEAFEMERVPSVTYKIKE